MSFVEEREQVLVGPEEGIDVEVVADVVAVVFHRGGEDRADPEEIDPEFPEIVEFLDDAFEIPDAVPIRILIGRWVNDVPD